MPRVTSYPGQAWVALVAAGVIRRPLDGVKLLGKGELKAKLNLPMAATAFAQFTRMTKLGLGELDKSGIAELTFKGRAPKPKKPKKAKAAAKPAPAKRAKKK